MSVALPDSTEQEFIDACVGERACRWEAGDIAADALDRAPTPKLKAKVANHLASIGHSTSAHIRQIAAVSRAFEPGLRAPDRAWILYLACIRAARRLNEAPATILQRALDSNLHAKAVNAMGKRGVPGLQFADTCPECGVSVTVKAEAGTVAKGVHLRCPNVECPKEGAATLIGRLA